MNKKTKKLFYIFSILLFVFLGQNIYIMHIKSMYKRILEKKRLFVNTIKLPDLAIYCENMAVRHRSLANVFSIYSYDGTLKEYLLSSYTISHSHIENK